MGILWSILMSVFLMLSFPSYSEAAGAFFLTDSMALARSEHTETRLLDGRVLLIDAVNAEIYDPDTDTFSTTGSLATNREFHTATLLPDGRVLVAGGKNGSTTLDSTEIYNPVTGVFTAAGNMNSPREQHTATLLSNGTVLIAGGLNGGYLSTAEIFDPSSGFFNPTGSMTATRRFHTATTLQDGKVLLTGGYHPASAGGGGRSEAETYNPVTGTFTATASNMTSGRNVHTGTLLPDGRVLILGGFLGFVSLDSAELYDPVTRTFSATGNMHVGRLGGSSTLLEDGTVLVAGGLDYASLTATSSAEIYDPSAASFTLISSMNFPRYLHSATLLPDGRVLMAGGSSASGGSGNLSSAEVYDDPCVGESLANLNLELLRIVDNFRLAFRDPAFVIPGLTLQEKFHHLADAILSLNPGHKRALYRNLR